MKSKKLKYVIFVVSIVGLIAGALFFHILNNVDKESVINSINSFKDNVVNNDLNYLLTLKSSLITSILTILIIWFLGVSVIGLPIIMFIYFVKVFAIGFTISSITYIFKLKGIIYAFIYMFPHNILNILIYAFISIYSIIYSYRLSNSFFKSEKIDLKLIMDKHKYVLLVSLIGVIITSLYGTFIMPYLFKVVLNLLK